MDQRLIDVTRAGDIDELYALLGQNPFILEEIDKIPFIETPLHIAVLAGEIEFAAEIVNLKPSFAKKLNPDGYSPLHLASQNGNLEMVKELLKVSGHELCLIKGREKKTPLHCAAAATASAGSNVEVVIELFFACREAITELTVRHETAFHLAVKSGNLDALKVLAQKLEWSKDKEILNWKDYQGNTPLHLAVSTRQQQVVELLLSIRHITILPRQQRIVKVNTMNKNNHTPLDVLLQDSAGNMETENILRGVGAISSNVVPSRPWFAGFFKNHMSFHQSSHSTRRWKSYFEFEISKDSPSEVRNALLVVFVLIATATFQAGTNPPGGVWQADSSTPDKTTTTTTTSETNTAHPHIAGTAILSDKPHIYYLFTIFNLVGFVLSLNMIYILTEGLPLCGLFGISLFSMLGTYMVSLQLLFPLSSLLALSFGSELFCPTAISMM